MTAARVARLMVAGTASGVGKTVVSCALMRSFRARGLMVQACKCGPDYIDPGFHERVLGVASRNLDLFLGDADLVRDLLIEGGRSADITLIEGAMGYYDGIACGHDASAWDVARSTSTPVVLVADCRGRALSVAAELAGYAHFRDPSQVAGVILNRVSPSLYPRLRAAVEREVDVPVLGYVPRLDVACLESRHLGLVGANEVEDLVERIDRLAATIEGTVDVDGLLAIAASVPPLPCAARVPSAFPGATPTAAKSASRAGAPTAVASADLLPDRVAAKPAVSAKSIVPAKPVASVASLGGAPGIDAGHGAFRAKESVIALTSDACLAGAPVIAVARDAAFSFYYRDTLDLLSRLGARLSFFSPLDDDRLPEGTCGLYLGGGYPELHAARLSANAPLRAAVAEALAGGLPTIAECGGFLYLHEELEDSDGVPWPMVGAIPARAWRGGSLRHFGYVTLTARHDGLLADAGGQLRAHEFHYWESDAKASSFHAEKPGGGQGWDAVVATATLHAGFPHLYLPGCPEVAARFVRACAAYGRGVGRVSGDARPPTHAASGQMEVAGARTETPLAQGTPPSVHAARGQDGAPAAQGTVPSTQAAPTHAARVRERG